MQSSSIGIIGGADGPTTLFFSGGFSMFSIFSLLLAAVGILAVAAVVVLLVKSRNK